jgi:hypothetical protein
MAGMGVESSELWDPVQGVLLAIDWLCSCTELDTPYPWGLCPTPGVLHFRCISLVCPLNIKVAATLSVAQGDSPGLLGHQECPSRRTFVFQPRHIKQSRYHGLRGALGPSAPHMCLLSSWQRPRAFSRLLCSGRERKRPNLLYFWCSWGCHLHGF